MKAIKSFIAGFLVLMLLLPNSAYALRSPEAVETPTRGGLEEKLKQPPVRYVPQEVAARPAAGMEEQERLIEEIIEAFRGILGGWRESLPSKDSMGLNEMGMHSVVRLSQLDILQERVRSVVRWLEALLGRPALLQAWNDREDALLEVVLAFLIPPPDEFAPGTMDGATFHLVKGHLSLDFLREVFRISPVEFRKLLFLFRDGVVGRSPYAVLAVKFKLRESPEDVRADLLAAYQQYQASFITDLLRDPWEEFPRSFPSTVPRLKEALQSSPLPAARFWAERIDPTFWKDPEKVELLRNLSTIQGIPVPFGALMGQIALFERHGLTGQPLPPELEAWADAEKIGRSGRMLLPETIAAAQLLLGNPTSLDLLGKRYRTIYPLKKNFYDYDPAGPWDIGYPFYYPLSGENAYGNTLFFMSLPEDFPRPSLSPKDYRRALDEAKEHFYEEHRDAAVPPYTPHAAGLEEPVLMTKRTTPEGPSFYVGDGRWIRSILPEGGGQFTKTLLQGLRLPGVSRPNMEVLELGTGEGSIAVGIAGRVAHVDAVELDAEAAQRARQNVNRNGLSNVQIYTGDLTAPVSGKTYDLIITDPPAVPFSRRMREAFRGSEWVRLANDGGTDGRTTLERILREAAPLLKEGGSLILNHPGFIDLSKTERLVRQQMNWPMEILFRQDVRLVTPPPSNVNIFQEFRSQIENAHGIPYRRSKGRLAFQLFVLRLTRPAGSSSTAAGLEERSNPREAAMAADLKTGARRQVIEALEKLYDAEPASMGTEALVFTRPDTFDLVPLALRWGRKVAVLSDDPKAQALQELLESMPDRFDKNRYAVGIGPASLFLDKYDRKVWISSRKQGLDLLRLPWQLEELPEPVAQFLKATCSFLDLAA